jgi:NACHT domain
VLWALLLLPWVVALILVRRHHHLDGGAVGIVAGFSVGLPTLWVTWAAYRDARRSAASVSGPTMAQVADQLAVAVGTQWADEAAVRRLNDPYPLPVAWAAADPSLTDPWDSLTKLAATGAGWPAPPPARTWAAGPEDLAGKGGELVQVLARVPTGLVVLGEPGAGKTMLMARLVLDLLVCRDGGGPVPFLVSAASWNPAAQDLRGWLGDRLLIDHPALAGPPPAGTTGSSLAGALLASGLILPVLDGLDEIPEQVRGPAISRINDALRPGEQVVVTCRSDEYRAVVRPQGGAEVTLRAAAAVQLRPLDADAVRSYLCDDAAGPVARARWDPVLAVLGTGAPAGQALGTPLMVGLARAVYNPRPGELAGALSDPAEMCDPALADRTAVESLLFDAFIPAAYRPDPASRWTAQDAEKWLVFLARHLERIVGGPDLAWWQLREAVSRTALRLAAGLAAGIAVGLAGGLAGGLAFGLAFGLAGGLTGGLAVGLAVGLAAGLAGGLTVSMLQTTWPSYMLTRGWLALHHQLPWPLMSFLADAHQRGVLRQAGAVYQFRHLGLEHRLATRAAGRIPHVYPRG